MRNGLVSSRAWAIVAVSVFSLVGCCLLAWWQWTRFESPSGTLQNLGYVLQWPLFGVFPAFMFWRIHRAASGESATTASDPTDAAAAAGAPPASVPARPPSSGTDTVGEWTSRYAYVQNRTVIGDHAGPPPGEPAGKAAGGAAAGDEEEAELVAYNRYLARLSADEEPHVR